MRDGSKLGCRLRCLIPAIFLVDVAVGTLDGEQVVELWTIKGEANRRLHQERSIAGFDVIEAQTMPKFMCNHVAETIGPIAKPKSIVFTADLPKTRSGKIMRRLLKDISEQRQLGDVTTLANADIVAELTAEAASSED